MHKIILIIAIYLSASSSLLLAQSKLEKHFLKGEYNEVLAVFNKLVEEGRADVPDFQLAAKCYELQYNFSSAINCYQQALAIDSLDKQTLEGLADAEAQTGLKNEALLIYEALLDDDTTNTRISGKYAALLMDADQYKQAEEIYARLVYADSNSTYFNRKLITAVYKQEDFQRVVPIAEKYLIKQPTDVEMHLVLATSYQRLDSSLLAINELNRLLLIDSLNLTAISKLAYIYFNKLKDYEKAVNYYRILNEREHNSDPTHLMNLGICEFFIGNCGFSANLLDSLTDILQTDAMIHFYTGLSYKRLGETDLALEFLERSAFLAVPAYVGDIYHHLGRAYSSKRMFSQALTAFTKVREIDPSNFMVLFDLAVTHEEYNLNRKEALKFYQQFLEECKNPESIEAQYVRSRINSIKEQFFFEGQ